MSQSSRLGRIIGLFAALLLLPLAAAADEVETLPFSDRTFAEPERHFSATQECVAPEEEMKRNHMKYILHQRDETMHEGIRTRQYALEECVNCHATKDENGEYLSIKGPNQFCSSCHAYAAVKIDCFQCHSSRPVRPSKLGSGAAAAAHEQEQLKAAARQLLATEGQAE